MTTSVKRTAYLTAFMKNIGIILLILLSPAVFGQKQVPLTDAFTVQGKIKTEKKFTLTDLAALAPREVGDLIITNHLGEKKGTARNLRGVLLKDVLTKIDFAAESPKVLSEFFLTCIAADGYQVVFSWNEIFNTETGNHVFIITGKDGKELAAMDDRILLVSTNDFRTGRRHVKGLEKNCY